MGRNRSTSKSWLIRKAPGAPHSTAASEPATQGTPTLAPSAAEMEGSAGTLADELSGDLGFSSFNDLDVSVDDLAEFKLQENLEELVNMVLKQKPANPYEAMADFLKDLGAKI